MENNNIKNYLNLLDIVQDELRKLDPINLSPGELTPFDEYDIEAKIIAGKVAETKDCKVLAEEMKIVFNKSFNENFSADVFLQSAERILSKTGTLFDS